MSIVAVEKFEDKIRIVSDSRTVRGNGICRSVKCDFINGALIGGAGYTVIRRLAFYYLSQNKIESFDKLSVYDWFHNFCRWCCERTGSDIAQCLLKRSSLVIAGIGRAYIIRRFAIYEVNDYDAIGIGRDVFRISRSSGIDCFDAVRNAAGIYQSIAVPLYCLDLENDGTVVRYTIN